MVIVVPPAAVAYVVFTLVTEGADTATVGRVPKVEVQPEVPAR